MADEATPLWLDDQDRHETLRLIPWWDQDRLSAAKILVVGAGALGNEVIKNLVLLGIGQIAIVDIDTIEASNLSRSVLFRKEDQGRAKAVVAAERGAEIDPQVRLIPLVANVIDEIGLGWFADADLVLGCLDNREARLWVNRCCWHVGTPWIDAGIQELSGVVQLFRPPAGSCYECGMKEEDYRLLNLRYSCPLLGAEEIQRGRVPTTPTIASLIAAWQVQEATKWLHGLPSPDSTALVFHGMTNHVYRTTLPRRDDCLSHDPWPAPIRLPRIDHDSTLAELVIAAAAARGQDARGQDARGTLPYALRLLRDVVTGFHCPRCGTWESRRALRRQTERKEALCPGCGEVRVADLATQIEVDGGADRSVRLRELGIPRGDIVSLLFDDGMTPFRLGEETFATTPPPTAEEAV